MKKRRKEEEGEKKETEGIFPTTYPSKSSEAVLGFVSYDREH